MAENEAPAPSGGTPAPAAAAPAPSARDIITSAVREAEAAAPPEAPAETPEVPAEDQAEIDEMHASLAGDDGADEDAEAEPVEAKEEAVKDKKPAKKGFPPPTEWPRILKNQRTKAAKAARDEMEKEIGPIRKRAEYAGSIGALFAKNNPEEIFETLSKHVPAFQGYAIGKQGTIPADDPEPKPDGKKADGSPGWTDEGAKKWVAWQERQTIKKAEKAFRDKHGHLLDRLEQEEQSRAIREAEMPVVTAQVALAEKLFGKHFVDDRTAAEKDPMKSEVLAYMKKARDEDRPVTYFEALSATLVPKMQAQIDSLTKQLEKERGAGKEDAIKELRQKAEASSPVPVSIGRPDNKPKDPREIIRQNLRKASGGR